MYGMQNHPVFCSDRANQRTFTRSDSRSQGERIFTNGNATGFGLRLVAFPSGACPLRRPESADLRGQGGTGIPWPPQSRQRLRPPPVKRLPTTLLLAPALIVTVGLTGGAVALGFARSFGVQPFGNQRADDGGVGRGRSPVWAPRSVGMTLWVASVATLLSGLFGVAAAWGCRRCSPASIFAGSRLCSSIEPCVPHVVIAVGTLFLLGSPASRRGRLSLSV